MGTRTIKAKDLKPSAIRKLKSKTTRFVGNQKVVNNARIIKNVSARNEMVKNGLIPNTQDNDPKSIAWDVLAALNVTVINEMGANFSLSDLDTKETLLENQNILNPSSVHRRNKLEEPTNKFTNEEGTFYELDGDLPDYQKEAKRIIAKNKAPDLTSIVADIYDLNNGNNRKTPLKLSQFSK